jgi:hypothetical protein
MTRKAREAQEYVDGYGPRYLAKLHITRSLPSNKFLNGANKTL